MMGQALQANDDGSLALVWQSKLQTEIQNFSAKMQRDLALAGVNSYAELRTKVKTIEGYKKLA